MLRTELSENCSESSFIYYSITGFTIVPLSLFSLSSFSQKYPPVKFLSEKDRKRILVCDGHNFKFIHNNYYTDYITLNQATLAALFHKLYAD